MKSFEKILEEVLKNLKKRGHIANFNHSLL